jgi:hypothetical protein
MRCGSSEDGPVASVPPAERCVAAQRVRNGGKHEQAARVRQLAERCRCSANVRPSPACDRPDERFHQDSAPHRTRGARPRARNDGRRVAVSTERADRRGCVDGHGLRNESHCSTTEDRRQRRRARRLRRRTPDRRQFDHPSHRLETHPARQQFANVCRSHAGALLQGRQVRRAGELQLDVAVAGFRGGGDSRRRRHRYFGAGRFAQRSVHPRTPVLRRTVRYDGSCRRRRHRVLLDDFE